MLDAGRLAERLARGRAAAEAMMVDTCQITAPDPDAEPVWNPSTARYEQPSQTLYGPSIEPHAGKCKIKAPSLVNPFQSGAAVETWQVEESVLSLPFDAPAIPGGAVVEYLTSAHNPNLAGRIFGVTGPHHESMATAQRILVREIVGTGGG